MSTKRSIIALAAVGVIAAADFAGLIAERRTAVRAAPAFYRGSIPPPGIPLPRFTLPRYNGGSITSSSVRGRVVLTTFVDSACHDKCPIIVGILGRTLALLTPAERSELVPLAFSVDPKVDTPAHVRRFLRERHALGLTYLVGRIAQMRPVWKKFFVLPATETGNANVHSADVRIFDRRNIWVSTQHAGVDLTPQNLVHDIRQALKES